MNFWFRLRTQFFCDLSAERIFPDQRDTGLIKMALSIGKGDGVACVFPQDINRMTFFSGVE
jgi:hypothetical protein